jgi:hypothetical protein
MNLLAVCEDLPFGRQEIARVEELAAFLFNKTACVKMHLALPLCLNPA